MWWVRSSMVLMVIKRCPALCRCTVGPGRTKSCASHRWRVWATTHTTLPTGRWLPSPGNKAAQVTTKHIEKSLVHSHYLFPRRRPSYFPGFPLGSLLRCMTAEQFRTVLKNFSFSQMYDSTFTHSQNFFSLRKPPLQSEKSEWFPQMCVLQHCHPPVICEPTTGNHIPLGCFSTKKLLTHWTCGREWEWFKGWQIVL